MLKTYTTNNKPEQLEAEYIAYKKKSEIDDILRKFGNDINICISRTLKRDDEPNPPCAIAITPSDLWNKMDEFGFSDGENELYEIYINLADKIDNEELISRVKTMLEAYKNSIFSIAKEDNELFTAIFYNEEEYMYIVENTVVIFNEDMQQIGTATVEDINYNADGNIRSVTYTDYEPTKHYTYVYNKKTFSGRWQ